MSNPPSGTTPSFVSKPSDIAMMVIGLGMVCFMFWVMAQASKRSAKSGNEFGFGCDVALGFVVLIVLAAIAVGLLTGFQALYPGQ